MLEGVEGRLKSGTRRQSRAIKVFLAGRRTMAADLGRLQEAFPEVEIGSYPFHEGGRYGARLLLDLRRPSARLGRGGRGPGCPGGRAWAMPANGKALNTKSLWVSSIRTWYKAIDAAGKKEPW